MTLTNMKTTWFRDDYVVMIEGLIFKKVEVYKIGSDEPIISIRFLSKKKALSLFNYLGEYIYNVSKHCSKRIRYARIEVGMELHYEDLNRLVNNHNIHKIENLKERLWRVEGERATVIYKDLGNGWCRIEKVIKNDRSK